jgi:hypothetical protein
MTLEDSENESYPTDNRQSQAIAIQRQHRLQHFIDRTLPSIHGIINLLGDMDHAVPSETMENLDEFISTVAVLGDHLNKVKLHQGHGSVMVSDLGAVNCTQSAKGASYQYYSVSISLLTEA